MRNASTTPRAPRARSVHSGRIATAGRDRSSVEHASPIPDRPSNIRLERPGFAARSTGAFGAKRMHPLEPGMSQDQLDAEAFRNFERAAHDEIADGYRDFFAAVTRYAVDPMLDAVMDTSGARILDVATGPGVVAFRAAARGASSVVGVDL